MSKYTTEVRFICESEAGLTESKGFNNIDSILTQAAPKIFNFDFPIFNEEYRLPLEKAILRHFYTREICEETVGLWKLRLYDKMNLIMPRYNKLFESELIEFDPMNDVDYTRSGSNNEYSRFTRNLNDESHSGDNNVRTFGNTDTITGNSFTTRTDGLTQKTSYGKEMTETKTGVDKTDNDYNDSEWSLFSDTPQGGVAGILAAEQTPDPESVGGNGYLTNATHNTRDNHDDITTTYGSTVKDTTDGDDTVENTGTQTHETHDGNTTQHTGTIQDNRSINAHSSSGGYTTDDRNAGHSETVVGKMSGHTFSEMLKQYRETFLNIEMMIMKDLEPLFFGLW